MDRIRESFRDEISEILKSFENESSMAEKLRSLEERKIFIYGAGNAGTMTFKLLEDAGVQVEAFFDRRGGSDVVYLNKPVLRVDEYDLSASEKEKTLAIIAFICDSGQLAEMRTFLAKAGYRSTLYFHDIYNLLITNKLVNEKSKTFDVAKNVQVYFNDVKERVLKVASLWADDESRAVYRNFLRAILSADPELFSPPAAGPQYFVDDIPYKKGCSRFIDCGAFDGDTAASLKKCRGEARAIACFEPDSQNFVKLCSNLRAERAAAEQFLFPCGVWKRSEMLRFRSGLQSASGIFEEGDACIQCVSIDDVIPDFKATFIKMDIEGAEYEALLGARKTIEALTPDLAISVYHRVDHLWEIPLLVQSMAPRYEFYLRSHGLHGMETIMYAVCG